MTPRVIRVKVGERWFTVEVEDISTSPIRANIDGQSFLVEVEGHSVPVVSPNLPPLPSSSPSVALAQAPVTLPSRQVTASSDKVLRAPMPARIVAIRVRPGESVTSGQELCVLEAMKMEQSLCAPANGVVKTVHVAPLQQVATGDPLVELE